MAALNESVTDTSPSVFPRGQVDAGIEPKAAGAETSDPTAGANRLEAVACRIAAHARAEVLPRLCAQIDEPAFREDGGTEETLELLASLALGRLFDRCDATVAVGHEFGITIPEDDPDEREKALTRITSKLGPLVQRVYEIASDARATEADMELAGSLAARAPGRMYARRAAGQQMAGVSVSSWRFLLVDMLAEQLKIPESVRYRLIEHPAIEPAIALLNERSAASPPEIERWRPQFRFDGSTEQTALRIAADARRLALTETVDRLRESEPDLTAEQAITKATAIVDDNPAWWGLDYIEAAARGMLGSTIIEPGYHPAALRAEQLIPRLMSSYEALIYDQSMKPRDAASEIIAGVRRVTEGNKLGAPPPGLAGVSLGLPSPEPALFVTTTLQVRYVSGHPGLQVSNQSRWLIMTNMGTTVFANPRAKRPLAVIEYDKVASLRVEGPNRVGSRTTTGGGRFPFAPGRRPKLAYLVFEPAEGAGVIFEVPDSTPSELESMLAPLRRWFENRSSGPSAA